MQARTYKLGTVFSTGDRRMPESGITDHALVTGVCNVSCAAVLIGQADLQQLPVPGFAV